MSNLESHFPLEVGIVVLNAAQLTAVYALLGGVSASAVVVAAPKAEPAPQATAHVSEGRTTQADTAPAGTGPSATNDASLSDPNDTDAHGWPWSAELHASTKGKTKDGLWRMKVGVTRPDPKPGFPVADGATAQAGSSQTQAPESALASQGGSPDVGDDDDEFAVFRAAAAKSDAEDAAAKAGVPARKWTDADLGALCNQAAVKLGDPMPIKEIIAKFAAEGETPHSRNVPADKRAAFAKAVEEKAGIEFAG